MTFLLLVLQTAFALSNAQPALDTAYDSVITYRTIGVDENNQEAPGWCNATLIGPKIMVTAAHCVAQSWVLKKFNIQLTPGYYKYGTRPDGSPFRVGYVYSFRQEVKATFQMKPSLLRKLQTQGLKTKISPDEDIAFVTWTDDLPLRADFPYAHLLSNEARAEVIRNPQGYQPHVVTENFVEEATSVDTKRVASLNVLKYTNKSFESRSTARVANLDSGGPLFVMYRGQRYILGVVKGAGQTIFGKWDVYTLAETW